MGLKSLGIGLSSLRTNLASIETVGHNISNANTEGFSRQRVELATRLPNDVNAYVIGQGVQVSTIARISDDFLEGRLRKEGGVFAGFQESSSILNEVEFTVNELSDQDLSDKLNNFFNSINDFSINVDDNSTRMAMIEQGVSLATEFNRLDSAMSEIQSKINIKILDQVNSANLYMDKIAILNQEIVQTESGGFSSSKANDLRDKRDVMLQKLAQVLDIDVREESNGALYVSTGGQRLVSQSESFNLEAKLLEIDGSTKTSIKFATGSAFTIKGGRLEALTNARDISIADIKNKYHDLAGQFIFEMNKINSTGRGLEGFSTIESENAVFDPNVALDVAKLNIDNNENIFKVKSGSFDVVVENISNGTKKIVTINVDLNGVNKETTLNDLIDQLNAVPNIQAKINNQKKLEINSTNSNIQFYFKNDSSNFLAAVGMNSFFTGVDASSIKVNANLKNAPHLVSGALSSSQGDNTNAVRFVELRNKLAFGSNGVTIDEYYQTILSKIAVETNRAKEIVTTHELIFTNLTNLKEEISGVSTDEEAADLIKFQRSYQASARFVSVVDELLDTLINRIGI